uniref:Uncharacterized protein n=1 Tax=Arundo donax TaxID=35708 RepID=A0A0A9T5X4_ARUDO
MAVLGYVWIPPVLRKLAFGSRVGSKQASFCDSFQKPTTQFSETQLLPISGRANDSFVLGGPLRQ